MNTTVIPTADRHPVVADFYPAQPQPGAPVVVLCHGFKGHRRWGFIPYLAARLADAGVAALAMDFSLNGHVPEGMSATDMPDDPSPFCAPEAFRRNTLARERDDLARVLAWVRASDPGPLGVWGHSRGGVAATLAALDDPSLGALATWATAAHPDFYTAHQKKRWRDAGGYEFTDSDTGTPLAIGLDYLDDIEAHAAEYDLAARAGQIQAAHLIVHGEYDMVIPLADAERLHEGAPGDRRRDKRLLRVATGHTFGYDGGPPGDALERATAATVEWFSRYLGNG